MASNGDVIKVRNGTYSGFGNINLSFAGKAITVTADDQTASSAVVIDCGGTPNRAFVFQTNETQASILSYIKIRNGDVRTRVVNFVADKNGGAIKILGASPQIVNCEFEDCRAVVGGAIQMQSKDTSGINPNIASCVFRRCASDITNSDGGAIAATSGFIGTIQFCSFFDCYCARDGGAIAIANSLDSIPQVVSCSFVRNVARLDSLGYGGAIRIDGNAKISRCTFYDNFALSGAALYVSDGSNVEFERNIVAHNGASGIHVLGTGVVTFACNNLFANLSGSISGIFDSADVDANTTFLNPLFCDTASFDLTISSFSPCDEDSSNCGLLIGRYNDACSRCCASAGNVDNVGNIDIADLTFLVAYLQLDGAAPPCLEQANIDGIGNVDIADLTYLVEYLFFSGAAPLCP